MLDFMVSLDSYDVCDKQNLPFGRAARPCNPSAASEHSSQGSLMLLAVTIQSSRPVQSTSYAASR